MGTVCVALTDGTSSKQIQDESLLLQMLLAKICPRLTDMLGRCVRQVMSALSWGPGKDLVDETQAWSRIRTMQFTGAKAWVDCIDNDAASDFTAKFTHPKDVEKFAGIITFHALERVFLIQTSENGWRLSLIEGGPEVNL